MRRVSTLEQSTSLATVIRASWILALRIPGCSLLNYEVTKCRETAPTLNMKLPMALERGYRRNIGEQAHHSIFDVCISIRDSELNCSCRLLR